MTDAVERWLSDSPYARSLGVELERIAAERTRLRLPFRDQNANPGRALHGGCAASLAVMGGQALARQTLGEAAGPFHTAALQVSYLAAAIGEDVVAEATLLRRGKAMCFAEVDVGTSDGKSIAHATTLVRGRFGAAPPPGQPSRADEGGSDPGPLGPHIDALPFARARGIAVEHMDGGRSRIALPAAPANSEASGDVHEGAVLALLDTTGAMAAWAAVGPGPHRASTPALQARFSGFPAREDLVGQGRVVEQDGDLFWCDVEVAGRRSGCVAARGTVIYRIVTGS